MRTKIYTRTGDRGQTSLYGGKRVSKNNKRVGTYGTVDELNSFLGIIVSKLSDKRIKEWMLFIQRDLFLIGSYLAGAKVNIDVLKSRAEDFEEIIDLLDQKLPELRNFILPGGSEQSALFYYSRAIARRAERKLVGLSNEETVDEHLLIFFNRLSDLLFVLGRYVNFKKGIKETVWKIN